MELLKYKVANLLKKNIKFFFISVFAISQAQDYPFNIDDNITASLNVETREQEAFRNPLLGYNIFGFTSQIQKELIRNFDPTSVRFPHGLFANWYDWREDKTRVFGEETFDYIHRNGAPRETTIGELYAINFSDRNDQKVGIAGFEQLNRERKISKGEGFNVVWTFNMSADNEVTTDLSVSPETVAFYESLVARGFKVTEIEMGNENFYPSQRSSLTPNSSDYIARAKSMYKALKEKDPNIQVSIPLLRRGSFVDPDWNSKLTEDISYFDAITVHTYIGADPDDASNNDEAYSAALTARKSLETSTNNFALKNYHNHGGNNNRLQKPVWLTEWGVKSGGPNAASVLGMADCYLFMAENQDVYQRANWFSVNGKLNSFVVFDGNNIKYPLQKTAYGLTHEILKNVFENSTMLKSTMVVPNIEDDVKAVSARAVTKDGKTTVFVLNMTDKSVPFTLNMDGTLYTDDFTHKAMKFDNVAQERTLPFNENPLNLIKAGSGEIMLPPLSINTIFLGVEEDSKIPTITLTSPLPYSKYVTGNEIPLKATAEDTDGTISKVEFKINNVLLNAADTEAPYEDIFIPTESGTFKIAALATDNEGNKKETSILIYVVKEEPYSGTPIALPGIIEAEDYDKGGQGLAYNDNDTENRGGQYRLSEGVDVGSTPDDGYSVGYVAGGEWLQYSVNVIEAGEYDVNFKYASGRSGGGRISLSKNETDIFSSFSLDETEGWNDYKMLSVSNVMLEKGTQILRFTTVNGAYNLDNITFEKSTLSAQDFQLSKFKIYPNPSKNGIFTLTKPLNWEVYSLSGVRVSKGKSSSVDLSNFSKGIYILKTESKVVKLIHQ